MEVSLVRRSSQHNRHLTIAHPKIVFGIFVALLLLFSACNAQNTPAVQNQQRQQEVLQQTKLFIAEQASHFQANASMLKTASTDYYMLAKNRNFDYMNVVQSQPSQVRTYISQARADWLASASTYFRMEVILIQVSSLQTYDIILASGIAGNGSGEDDNDIGNSQGTVVPFDLTLPNGRVLQTPGNLLEVLETTLWNISPLLTTKVPFDYHIYQKDIGNMLPDANVLKSAADAMDMYASELIKAIQQWKPSLSDIFTALTQALVSVNDVFSVWQTILFGSDIAFAQFDEGVHSLLEDYMNIVIGWQNLYARVSPLVRTVSHNQDAQIAKGLKGFQSALSALHKQEQQGGKFTIEQTDLYRTNFITKANTINDRISLVADTLRIPIVLTP